MHPGTNQKCKQCGTNIAEQDLEHYKVVKHDSMRDVEIYVCSIECLIEQATSVYHTSEGDGEAVIRRD